MLARITSGFLLASGRVKCCAPARVNSWASGPPLEATRERPPASTMAWAICTVPRSTPPLAPSPGRTCRTVGWRAVAAVRFAPDAGVLFSESTYVSLKLPRPTR